MTQRGDDTPEMTSPGWYPSPDYPGEEQWWNGMSWSVHKRDQHDQSETQHPEPQLPSRVDLAVDNKVESPRRRPMTYPGWYPSEEFPGRMQWWDGKQVTTQTRLMSHHEKKLLEAESARNDSQQDEKSGQALDWLSFIPITAGLVSFFWLAFAIMPFAAGDRSVTHEKVNANIVAVQHNRVWSDFSYSRRRGYHIECKVIVSFTVDGKSYTHNDGDNCAREVGMKTPLIYDPKDISGTVTSGLLTAAQANVFFAAGTVATSFAAAGLLKALRAPLPEKKKQRRRPKSRR